MIQLDEKALEVGQKIEKKHEIRVVDEYDVVVAGGGVAGFAAAVAAGRFGAKVLLVERKNFIGGNAAMGLQILGTHTITGKRASAGIVGEFLRRLKAMGAASDAVRDARICSFVTVEPAWVKVLSQEMLEEAKVRVLLHSGVTDVICRGKSVQGVVVNGIKGIRCKVVVDTTGDGIIAAMAGAPFILGDESDGWLQPASLIFRMGNVNVENGRKALIEFGHQIINEEFINSLGVPKSEFSPWASEYFNCNAYRKEVSEAIRVGDLPADFPQQRVIWYSLIVPNEAIVLMAKVIGFDASQTEQLSEAEQRAMKMVPVLVAFMRKYIPGFESAHLIDVAPQIGIRETRRIIGEYVLEGNDILEGRRFLDNIGLGAYYTDIHPPRGGDKTIESMKYPLETYEMPYRCLLPKEVDQVLIAGRCSSATAEAFGAVRVIPSCMVQGQAAGSAAALCARSGITPKEISIDALQDSLRDQNVFLHPEDSDTKLVF